MDKIRFDDVIVTQNKDNLPPTQEIPSRRGRPRVEGGYIAIPGKPWMSTMRLSFSQGSDRFVRSGTGGKQCTAMAAYAAVKPPGFGLFRTATEL